MTDFSFRAARPKPQGEQAPQHDLVKQVETMGADSLLPPEKPARKRRTRAEIEAAEPGRRMLHETPNEMAVLKSCLKQLRQLDPKAALHIVQVMEVLFK
jgi:hypothetical protein